MKNVDTVDFFQQVGTVLDSIAVRSSLEWLRSIVAFENDLFFSCMIACHFVVCNLPAVGFSPTVRLRLDKKLYFIVIVCVLEQWCSLRRVR